MHNKKYIYYVYIVREDIFYGLFVLSYGYPTGILRLSYGEVCFPKAERKQNESKFPLAFKRCQGQRFDFCCKIATKMRAYLRMSEKSCNFARQITNCTTNHKLHDKSQIARQITNHYGK